MACRQDVGATHDVLACWFVINRSTITRVIGEVRPLLPACGRTVESGIRLRTPAEIIDEEQAERRVVTPPRCSPTTRPSPRRPVRECRPTSDTADLVLAVKWIGNVGSHDHRLRISDVLDGVEILDHTLEQIYDSTKDEIKRKAADIAARKGIPASRFSGPVPF